MKDFAQYREQDERDGLFSEPTATFTPFLPNDLVTANAARCSPSSTIAFINRETLQAQAVKDRFRTLCETAVLTVLFSS
jgi:hypothetical protein